MTLGEYIKQYRNEHDNMSIRQFGRLSDLSPTYIKKLEVGVNHDNRPISPTIETFGKVASAVGITLDELFSVVNGNVIVNSKLENFNSNPEYEELIELYKSAPPYLKAAAFAVLKSRESQSSTQDKE